LKIRDIPGIRLGKMEYNKEKTIKKAENRAELNNFQKFRE